MQHELSIDNSVIHVRANEEPRKFRFRSSRIQVRVDTENKEVGYDSKLTLIITI